MLLNSYVIASQWQLPWYKCWGSFDGENIVSLSDFSQCWWPDCPSERRNDVQLGIDDAILSVQLCLDKGRTDHLGRKVNTWVTIKICWLRAKYLNSSSSAKGRQRQRQRKTQFCSCFWFCFNLKTWYVLPQNWSQRHLPTSIPSKTENWIYEAIEYLKLKTLLFQK